MSNNHDIDIEVLQAGVAYTLYASALVNLAITINRGDNVTSEQEAVSKYGERLRNALIRCNVDHDIPVDMDDVNDILQILQSGKLMSSISNHLIRNNSRRQELIFILTCLIGGVISGSTSGVTQASRPAKSEAKRVALKLGVPESVIEKCFETEGFTPLRNNLRGLDLSGVIEAKPSIWGISVDIKKLWSIIKRWFNRNK